MTCHDFERLWNERLDARGTPVSAEGTDLDAHAASCPACHERAASYRLLSQALSRWTPTSTPVGFADRCLEALERPPARVAPTHQLVRFWPASIVVGAAAALLVMVLGGPRVEKPEMAAEPPHLADALAHVTSATWELAKEASAPAARIGFDVLDTTVVANDASQSDSDSASTDGLATEMLQSVSDRVSEGVRPLSGTARHAFGFLLGPTLAEANDSARPS